MPMCDIYIQEGALQPAAEAALVAEVSRLLSDHEVRSIRELGLGAGDEVDARVDRAESIAWMFVHRTATSSPDSPSARTPPGDRSTSSPSPSRKG